MNSRARWWARALVALLGGALAALLGAGLAAWLAIDQGPSVAVPAALQPADIGRVHALLKRHSPDRTPPGVMRAAWLGERDLELLLAEAGRRVAAELRPQVSLQERQATVRLSVALPPNPLGRWLNVHAVLGQTEGLPEVASLRVGHLPLPTALVPWAARQVLEAHQLQATGRLALQMIQRVGFWPDMAVVAFQWPAGDMRQLLANTLLPPAEQQRVKIHVEHLMAQLQSPARPGGSQPLSQALGPAFALVQKRLTQGGVAVGSPAEENRAALLALALLAEPSALPRLLPASAAWGPRPTLALTLRGRIDFALHFLVSALIAAEGSGPLADAVGVYKEVADSRGGSGFSFNDLAADRAGTRFGLLARQTPQALWQRLGAEITDADLLPPVDDLPEYLSEPEFRRRYGGLDAPGYRAMMADIESRLDRLELLAPPAAGGK